MKIIPKNGYILVSHFEIDEQKKSNVLILPGDEKKKIYLKVEADCESYSKGQLLIGSQYNVKVPVGENLFLMDEKDIIASVILEETE